MWGVLDYPYIPTAIWNEDEVQAAAELMAPKVWDLLTGGQG